MRFALHSVSMYQLGMVYMPLIQPWLNMFQLGMVYTSHQALKIDQLDMLHTSHQTLNCNPPGTVYKNLRYILQMNNQLNNLYKYYSY